MNTYNECNTYNDLYLYRIANRGVSLTVQILITRPQCTTFLVNLLFSTLTFQFIRNTRPGVDLIKLYFFGNAIVFQFFAVKLECLEHMKKKNVFSMQWPSLTAKIGKRRKQSLIGSTPIGRQYLHCFIKC